MIERKVYITVNIDTEDIDDADEVFEYAIDAFFGSLETSVEQGDIQGYVIEDVERK